MRIALDVSPLENENKIRGTGFYTENLKKALEKYFPENTYAFFTQEEKLTQSVDVIHYPYFDPFFLSLPFKKSYPTIVTVHDLTPLVFPEHFPAGIKGKLKWSLQRHNLHKVDAIIADSQQSKKDIVRFTGINEHKIHVIYLAAGEQFTRIKNQESRIKEIKKRYNLPEKFVLYVGDVTWNKNLPRLLKAIKKTNIPLVMVGKALVDTNFDATNPWNADRLLIQKLSEGDNNIIRLGFVPDDDLVTLYNIATVSVMSSIYEGFGLPVLESMACGCPVITTSGGSLAEVAGNAAIFVDGYDEDSMRLGIKKVYNDLSLQKELSKKGLERAQMFSWKKVATETIDVYKKVSLR